MAESPFFHLIQEYFPPSQWDNADCIQVHECSPDRPGFPQTCIGIEGYIDCSAHQTSDIRSSYGPFQIFESCWNPDRDSASPFTREQWAQVLDPNVNTWMASVIFSGSGWGGWGTASICGLANVGPEPVPHPYGPVNVQPPQPAPPIYVPQPVVPVLTNPGVLLLSGGVMLFAGLLAVERLRGVKL